MAITDVDICNLALLNVGVSAKIISLGENTKHARACNAQYTLTRDELLMESRRDWTFARKRAILVASSSVVRTGFGYVYDAPTDMLRPRRIWNGFMRYRPEEEIAYRVEDNDAVTGQIILCDVASDSTNPELWYTRKLTDPTKFSPHFVKALAWTLAAQLVLPEIISADAQGKAEQKAEKWLLKAIQVDVSTEKINQPPKDAFTASRGRPYSPGTGCL